jgi:Bacterial Ig domain/Bacterial Ig-like domain (group 3)
MRVRGRAVSLIRFSALCKAIGAIALCGAVVAPLAMFGTATAGAAPPLEAVSGTNELEGVACSTPTNCVAVGFVYEFDFVELAVVVPISNGIAGTAQLITSSGPLSAVACPTATSCLAVGGNALVPITNGIAGTPQAVAGFDELNNIACTSSTQCWATGTDTTTSPSSGIVVPITNGTPGTPEEVTASGSVSLGGIACLTATDCVATGSEAVPTGPTTTQGEGASIPIVNGTLGSLVLDSAVTGFGGGTCPTATGCLFQGSSANPASPGVMVVPIDGNANPGIAQLVPGGAGSECSSLVLSSVCHAGSIACPSSPNHCGLVPWNLSGTGYIVPITNGIPGNPVSVPGTSSLDDVTCPTSTSCLVTGTASTPPTQANGGIVLPVSPPTTTVVLPSNGATVTGGTWLDAGASNSAGIASVTYEVSGGPNSISDKVVSSSSPTLYGYIGKWDSTDVPNGTYTLQSVATDAAGWSTISAPITVTVNNPPPSTAVGVPSNNTIVSGTTTLDANSSGGVSQVTYEVSGGPANLVDDVIATGTLTYYGWLSAWNTTGVANGTYTLQSVATYSGGVSGTSAPVTITVDNPPPTTTVGLPSNNATVTGLQYLDSSASSGVTQVQYDLTGGTLNDSVIATGTPTIVGWLTQWDSTTVPNGTYQLNSVASYPGGVSGTSSPITITVSN